MNISYESVLYSLAAIYRHFTGRTLWTLFRGLRASTLLAAIPLPSWLLLGVPDALLYRLLLSDKVLYMYVHAVKPKHVTQLLTYPLRIL